VTTAQRDTLIAGITEQLAHLDDVALEVAARLVDSLASELAMPGPVDACEARLEAEPGYERLAEVLDEALEQAQSGKGHERHAGVGEAFHDQQIVQLGAWMGSTHFEVGQACKKAIESTRLGGERGRRELLGAINYLAAAVLLIDDEKAGG
jgi:hypothetical protein